MMGDRGNAYLDLFGQTAEKLIGIPAVEYKQKFESANEDDAHWLEQLKKELFTKYHIVFAKPKIEVYNGNIRKKFSATAVYKFEGDMFKGETESTLDRLKNRVFSSIKLK